MSKTNLFKKSQFFKKYWFIESFVFLGIWVGIMITTKGDISSIFNIYWGFFHKAEIYNGDNSYWYKAAVGIGYSMLVLSTILISIWKHLIICTSLSCYCEEKNSPEEFNKWNRILKASIGASTIGLIIATPLIYILSFIFRLLFWKILKEEESKCEVCDITKKE